MTSAAGDAHGRASYRFGPACIAVASDDRDAGRWLREFLTPWFVPGPPDENPLAVRMTSSAPAALRSR